MLCRVNLELEGYRVLEASTSEEIDQALATDDVAGLLLDLRLGPEDGTEIARRLRTDHPSLRIAFLTGDGSRGDARGEAADGFLAKPFSLEELSATVASLVHRP